ncbi:hypothetical protein [Paucibacter soli]|uniref:hypothetical protein n=1 Tax=Paucibacter soli TaxID=3133433 RepID=UPI0030AD8BFB
MRMLVRSLLLLLSLLLIGVISLVLLALQAEPLVSNPLQVNAAEVQRARAVLSRNDPRSDPQEGLRVARLSAGELELLVNQLAQSVRPMAVRLRLRTGGAGLEASLRLPLLWPGPWLNLRAELLEAPGWPLVSRLRLGRLPLPDWLSERLLRGLMQQLMEQTGSAVPAEMLHQISFAPDRLLVVYEWRKDSLDRLLGVWAKPAEQARFKLYQQRLVAATQAFAPGSAVSLAALLPPLFELAAQRSAQGEDPQQENRAAVLTLALHASGQHWSKLIPAARGWPRATPLTVTLAGRDDFSQHFLISAALAIEGGGPMSKAIGVYKELADARGGSGFSFNDIAADQAGTRLGLLAMEHASQLQQRLRRPLPESHYMPAVADLPEFLSEAEFQRRYGGVGGAGYLALLAQIEARIAALELFR